MAGLNADFRQYIEREQIGARPLLAEIASRMPQSAEARALLGAAYLRNLEAAPALEHFKAAHELDPKNLAIRHQMGLCAVISGDYEGALGIYRDAMSIPPTEHSASMAALMLHRLGRAKEAVEAYSNLLVKLKRDHPEAPHALRGAAMLLRDVGAPLAAERFMHEVIVAYRLNPLKVAFSLVERDNSIDYFGWTRFADKGELAQALQRSETRGEAPRHPKTFVLPEDRDTLIAYAHADPKALLIAKPRRGTGGRGITISRRVEDLLDQGASVVQRYVEDPVLVDGRKGHVRLYGLVTSLNPFRAYIYREGVVRFAPATYDLSDKGIGNLHAHVTNTALHEGHPELVIAKDTAKEDEGAIWSLSAYLKRLGAEGLDSEVLWAELKALMRRFVAVLAAEGLFAAQAKAAPRRAFPAKLFGLDVLIDAQGKPWLIEMQRKPALAGAAIVQKVNGRMFQTIFEMSCNYAAEDGLNVEALSAIARDPAVLATRDGEREIANRGMFEGVGRQGHRIPNDRGEL